MSDGGSTMVKKKNLQGKEIGIAQWKRVIMLSMASVEESYNVKHGFSEKILFQQYESFIKRIL